MLLVQKQHKFKAMMLQLELEIAELDDQLSKTNTLDFEELKSELSQAKREIEAEDEQIEQQLKRQEIMKENQHPQQRMIQHQHHHNLTAAGSGSVVKKNTSVIPDMPPSSNMAPLRRQQNKTVRTSYGGEIGCGGPNAFGNNAGAGDSGMMVPVIHDSSHAAPVSVCQYVNPMETDYSQQTDSPTQQSKAQMMKHYDLHSISPPERNDGIEITNSSATASEYPGASAAAGRPTNIGNEHFQFLKDVRSPLSGSDSLENLRQRRDHIRSQIRQVNQEVRDMESEIQKEIGALESREHEDETRFSQSQVELDRQIIELKRRQDSLQRQMDAKQAILSQLVEAGQSMDHNQSFGCLSEQPPDSAKIREVDHDLKIQIERVIGLKQKCAQSLQNLDQLRQLYDQISEEICMTNEDKEAQKQVQADLVARREDLDLIFLQQSKNTYGQEFTVFLQLQDSTVMTNIEELKLLYRAKKTATFVNDVIHQLEQIKDSSEDTPSERSKAQKKTFQQQNCMIQQNIQKFMMDVSHGSQDLAQNENSLLQNLVDLAGVIGIPSLTLTMLLEKLEQCSDQKDQIFKAKANKMQEITSSIRQLDRAIEEKRNLIENEIDASLKEAFDTLESTQAKIDDMETAHDILIKKVQNAEKSVGELRIQESSMQREKDRIIQIKSIQLEFDHLREQRHALLEKQLILADKQRQIEREHRTTSAELRKKKQKLESQTHVLGKKLQREKLEKKLGQIEDLISQTIIEQERRFVEFQKREIQQQFRFSRDNSFSVTQQAVNVLPHHHITTNNNKEGLLSENNAMMSHVGSSSQLLTTNQLKSNDEQDSPECPKTEVGDPQTQHNHHVLQSKSTIEFNTDKQEQRKREVNSIKHQSQSLGVNHSVNHNINMSTNVRSSNMSTIEEQKRPGLINIEHKENNAPTSAAEVVQSQTIVNKQQMSMSSQVAVKEPQIQTNQQTDLEMIRNLLLQQQAQLIKLQQAQELQNKSCNQSNSDAISQQVISNNQLANILSQTAQSPMQNCQLIKSMDMKMWKTNDNRTAEPRQQMPQSPLKCSESLFNQTKVNNELQPMQRTLQLNCGGEDTAGVTSTDHHINQKTQMSFAENSGGSLSHHFNRLITQESFGHPMPKATNKTNFINSIQSKKLQHQNQQQHQPTEQYQMLTFQNSDSVQQTLKTNIPKAAAKHQSRYHQANLSNEEAASSSYLPLDSNSQQHQVQMTNNYAGGDGGSLQRDQPPSTKNNQVQQNSYALPEDPSIAHASSLQLLSPLSQSMSMHVGMMQNNTATNNTVSMELPFIQQQHQQLQQFAQQQKQSQQLPSQTRSQSREGSQTRILAAAPLAPVQQTNQNQSQLVNTSCQNISLMRNVLSSDTLDQHYCQSEMPLNEFPVQQSSMESLNFNQHFMTTCAAPQNHHHHQPPKTEQQRLSRKQSSNNTRAASGSRKMMAQFLKQFQMQAQFITTRPKSQTKKRSKQDTTTGRYANQQSSGKRSEGQARKTTNFIKKKVNQSLAFKNQSVNYANHQLGQDLELISRLLPLIDGQILYKKFSTHQSISQKAFDPLFAEKNPPEQCGYGVRLFQLSQDLKVITVKQSLRNSVL